VTLHGFNLELVGIVEDDEIFKPKTILGFELNPVSKVEGFTPDSILITSLLGIDLKKDRLKSLIDVEKVCISDICY
jgi:hypothetical protein